MPRSRVSAASGWEIATKVRLGKLPAARELLDDLPQLLAAQADLAQLNGPDDLAAPKQLSRQHTRWGAPNPACEEERGRTRPQTGAAQANPRPEATA